MYESIFVCVVFACVFMCVCMCVYNVQVILSSLHTTDFWEAHVIKLMGPVHFLITLQRRRWDYAHFQKFNLHFWKMPVCSYFLRGVCTKDACPYLHVYVGENAEICQDFVKGFCPNGDKVDYYFYCYFMWSCGMCLVWQETYSGLSWL